MANTSSSPKAKRARKPYSLLNKKAPKQHAPPINVVNERSCKRIENDQETAMEFL